MPHRSFCAGAGASRRTVESPDHCSVLAGWVACLLMVSQSLTGCASVEPPQLPGAVAPIAASLQAPSSGEFVSHATPLDLASFRQCVGRMVAGFGPDRLTLLVDDGERRGPAAREGQTWLQHALSNLLPVGTRVQVFATLSPRQPESIPTYVPMAAVREFDARGATRGQAEARLDMDVQAMEPRDASLLPGTSARRSAHIFERDGRIEIAVRGQLFEFTAEGAGLRDQARRALSDLATAELLGRLALAPTWRCLGLNSRDPEVAGEVQSWYDRVSSSRESIVVWSQQQLKLRGLYSGPVDGRTSQTLLDAVSRYRAALGLSPQPRLDDSLFRAHLDTDPSWRPASAEDAGASVSPSGVPSDRPGLRAAVGERGASAPADPVPGAARLTLQLSPAQTAWARGEAVRFVVRPSRDAYVYCFHRDEKRRIARIFPNRFQPDARVSSTKGLELPGGMGFVIEMNRIGIAEQVLCMAAERAVDARGHAAMGLADLESLPYRSLDELGQVLKQRAGLLLAEGSLSLVPR